MKPRKLPGDRDPWQMMDRFFHGSWIENIVQQAMEQAMQPSDSAPLSHRVFETRRSVVARIRLPVSVDPENLRVYVSATSLRIAGLPGNEERLIRLPCEVGISGSRSTCRDRLLEVRMPKKPSSGKERQITINIAD